MPHMSNKVTALAAGASQANVVSGKMFEILTRPAGLTFMAAASVDLVLTTILVGPRVVVQDEQISKANRFPVWPDDKIDVVGAGVNARIFWTFRNSNAGAADIYWLLNIKWLA